jgi:hypothetical protein
MNMSNKHLYGILFCILFVSLLYGCSSSDTSVSGQLSIVAFGTSSTENYLNLNISGIKPEGPKKLAAWSYGSGENEFEFVPDEIIVKYKPGFDPDSAAGVLSAGGYFTKRSDYNIGRGSLSLLQLDDYEKTFLSPAGIRERTLYEISRLNSLSYVEYAEPNYIYKPLYTPAADSGTTTSYSWTRCGRRISAPMFQLSPLP